MSKNPLRLPAMLLLALIFGAGWASCACAAAERDLQTSTHTMSAADMVHDGHDAAPQPARAGCHDPSGTCDEPASVDATDPVAGAATPPSPITGIGALLSRADLPAPELGLVRADRHPPPPEQRPLSPVDLHVKSLD